MESRTITIVNCASCDRCAAHDYEARPGLGFHARPSAKICKFATEHKGKLRFRSRDSSVAAESIMGLMMLALVPRKLVSIEADNVENARLFEDLARLIVHGLGEPLCPDFMRFCETQLGPGKSKLDLENPLSLLTRYAEHVEANPTCIRGRRLGEHTQWT